MPVVPVGASSFLLAQQIDFCAQGRQFVLWVDPGPCPEVTSEAQKQNCKRCGND